MAKSYSVPLREAAIAQLESEVSLEKVSEIFRVSIRTLQRWKSQKKSLGHVSPKVSQGLKNHTKINYEALKAQIKQTPDATLHNLGERFKVTEQAIFYALKKLGITRKKKFLSTKKGMKMPENISRKE